MVVNQSMQNVMTGMANIMAGANGKMKAQNYQQTMKRFMTQKQRMGVLNQFVQDIMGQQDGQIQDQDVDKLINQMTHQTVEKRQKKAQLQGEMDMDEYQNGLNDL